MGEYIPFTNAQKEQARQTDLVAFLRQCGEVIAPSGSEFQWHYRGQKVTIRGNVWFNQYTQAGGDAIAFAQEFYGYNYPDAVQLLLSMNCGIAIPSYTTYPKKEFVPPIPNDNLRRAYTYLHLYRGIDREVLDAFVHRRLIYESGKYHNVVFVGCDKDGIIRHAHKRGTGKQSTYKGSSAGSDPEYSFHWVGTDNTLYLFEAPIDLLSYASLHKEGWRQHSYAAACCVSDRVMWRMLSDYQNLQKVFICFDSDTAGQEAAHRIQNRLNLQNISCEIIVPNLKDWNQDLLARKENST